MAGHQGYKLRVYSLSDNAGILIISSNLKVALQHMFDIVPGHFHFVLREYSVYWKRINASHDIVQKLPSGQIYTIRRHYIKKHFKAYDIREAQRKSVL